MTPEEKIELLSSTLSDIRAVALRDKRINPQNAILVIDRVIEQVGWQPKITLTNLTTSEVDKIIKLLEKDPDSEELIERIKGQKK